MKTDEQLFQEYVDGDDHSFTELHGRYEQPLRRYVMAKTNCDESSADEIIQRVFIRVVKHKLNFISGKLFKPWVYTIADKLTRDHRKGVKQRSKHVKTFADIRGDVKKDSDAVDTIDESLLQWKAVEYEDKVEAAEQGQLAMGLMQRLPKKLRNTLKLTVLDGLPNRVVGPLMNVSHMQVSNRERMALDILKKQMESGELLDAAAEDTCVLDDLLDDMDKAALQSLARVLFDNSEDSDDCYVFTSFVRRLTGETVGVVV